VASGFGRNRSAVHAPASVRGGCLSVDPAPVLDSSMGRNRSRRLRRLLAGFALALADLLALVAALVAARVLHALAARWLPGHVTALADPLQETLRIQLFGVWILVAVAWLSLQGEYWRRLPFWDEVRRLWRLVLVLAALDALVLFLAKWDFSRLWFLLLWTLSMSFLPLGRALARRGLDRIGLWNEPVLIVGTGANALETLEALRREHALGWEVEAFVSLRPHVDRLAHRGRSYPVRSLGGDIGRGLDEVFAGRRVVLAPEEGELAAMPQLLDRLGRLGVEVSIVPPLRGLPLFGMDPIHFFRHEVLMLRVRNNLARPGARLVKRAFDLACGGLLLIVLAPLLAGVALRIALGGGPVLFAHERVGQGGRRFRCYKFRTMVPDAEARLEALLRNPAWRRQWEESRKLRDDPRVTPFGHFLRRTSLDELPQLFNVLRGDMSLVGPRPVVTEELARYGEHVAEYLQVRPGITGLWQISGRSDADYDSRVRLDSWYVRNWNLWYDTVILMLTVQKVVRGEGAY